MRNELDFRDISDYLFSLMFGSKGQDLFFESKSEWTD